MESKDVVVATGIFVTLVLGVWNLIYSRFNNRRTTFINAVTAERVKWINTLRENLSQFAGLLYNYVGVAHDDDDASREIWKQTDRLRMLIKLQLNPQEPIDQKIEALLDQIYHDNEGIGTDGAIKLLDELIKCGQQLLKQEWDKVKEEAKHGDLRDSWNLKIRKFINDQVA